MTMHPPVPEYGVNCNYITKIIKKKTGMRLYDVEKFEIIINMMTVLV